VHISVPVVLRLEHGDAEGNHFGGELVHDNGVFQVVHQDKVVCIEDVEKGKKTVFHKEGNGLSLDNVWSSLCK